MTQINIHIYKTRWKLNCMSIQHIWLDNCTNWFIKLIKKLLSQMSQHNFKKFQKKLFALIRNDFGWFQFIEKCTNLCIKFFWFNLICIQFLLSRKSFLKIKNQFDFIYKKINIYLLLLEREWFFFFL